MKMLITLPDSEKGSVSAAAMCIGNVGIFTNGANIGKLLLKTCSNYVCLDDARLTWRLDCPPHTPVKILPAGTKISIELIGG
jgi:hypothetical protein